MKQCDKNIRDAIDLADKMIELASRGDAEREDVGCGILYGIVLDAAYKIKQRAEEEKKQHIAKGWWQDTTSGHSDSYCSNNTCHEITKKSVD